MHGDDVKSFILALERLSFETRPLGKAIGDDTILTIIVRQVKAHPRYAGVLQGLSQNGNYDNLPMLKELLSLAQDRLETEPTHAHIRMAMMSPNPPMPMAMPHPHQFATWMPPQVPQWQGMPYYPGPPAPVQQFAFQQVRRPPPTCYDCGVIRHIKRQCRRLPTYKAQPAPRPANRLDAPNPTNP